MQPDFLRATLFCELPMLHLLAMVELVVLDRVEHALVLHAWGSQNVSSARKS